MKLNREEVKAFLALLLIEQFNEGNYVLDRARFLATGCSEYYDKEKIKITIVDYLHLLDNLEDAGDNINELLMIIDTVYHLIDNEFRIKIQEEVNMKFKISE